MKKIIIILTVVFCTSCMIDDLPESYYVPVINDLVFEVSGTATSATLTWKDKEGLISQEFVILDHRYEVGNYKGKYDFSVKNNGNTGSIIIKMLVNDVEIREVISNGPWVIASLSGSL